MNMEFRYDCVVGAVRRVMTERKEDKWVDDYFEALRMEVCLCPVYVAENLVRHFLDDLSFVVMRTSVMKLRRENPTKIVIPHYQLPE